MSLNFDVSAIKNHEVVTTHPDDPHRWHPTTDALVMMAMVIEMGKITEANWRTYWARVHAYESLFGSYKRKYADDSHTTIVDEPITPDDVKAHIGLRMNVSEATDAQFSKKLLKWTYEIGDDAIKAAERAKAKEAEPATA